MFICFMKVKYLIYLFVGCNTLFISLEGKILYLCIHLQGITPVCHKLHMKIGTWKTKTGKDRKSDTSSKSLSGSLLERTNVSKKVSFPQKDIVWKIFGLKYMSFWVIFFLSCNLETYADLIFIFTLGQTVTTFCIYLENIAECYLY